MDNELIEKYKQEMMNLKARATIAGVGQENVMKTTDPNSGGLIVGVTTLDGLYPVKGADVRVFTGRSGGEDFSEIDFDLSDESGKTKEFRLSAPAKQNSETADTGLSTYSLYNISVKADGFVEQIYYGLPIFSGVTSLKVADLISVDVAADNTSPQIFEDTTDFNL